MRWRMDRAVGAYARREIDLSGAARYAGVSIHQMLAELYEAIAQTAE